MRARAILSSYLQRSLTLSRFPTKLFIPPAYDRFTRNSFVSPAYAKTGGCTPMKMSARRHLFSPFSQSPLSTLLRFNYLRALSFSVSHLSAILPTPSPLFHQKPGGTPHSGHTNASDGPCLSLRNLFSAFRLSVLCVSAVSPSSLYSPPATSFPRHSPFTSAGTQTSRRPRGGGCSSDASACGGRRRAFRRATL